MNKEVRRKNPEHSDSEKNLRRLEYLLWNYFLLPELSNKILPELWDFWELLNGKYLR